MCLVLLALLLSFSGSVNAWGPLGHEIASGITQSRLSESSIEQIARIIPGETLRAAALWPDRMRSSREPFWQQQAGAYHYVTVPDGYDYGELPPPEHGDAVTALAGFSKVLLDPDAAMDDQRLALRFTIHIIQDLHQPLHVGNGKDRGGTRYWVELDAGEAGKANP